MGKTTEPMIATVYDIIERSNIIKCTEFYFDISEDVYWIVFHKNLGTHIQNPKYDRRLYRVSIAVINIIENNMDSYGDVVDSSNKEYYHIEDLHGYIRRSKIEDLL